MDANFATLLDSVRQGDQIAAFELVQHYEPVVRQAIRAWLRKCSFVALHRIFDSTDICQSVLIQFFEKVNADQLNLESPEHLKNLLLLMARSRVVHHLRSNQIRRRDMRRDRSQVPSDVPEPASRDTPVDLSVAQELLEMIRARLTPEERELADRRARGETWSEIVVAMGGTADGRRVQLARVEVRIAAEFGLGASEPVA
jgi:RNA polymerase sigma-70 factor (ECF subfamily)